MVRLHSHGVQISEKRDGLTVTAMLARQLVVVALREPHMALWKSFG